MKLPDWLVPHIDVTIHVDDKVLAILLHCLCEGDQVRLALLTKKLNESTGALQAAVTANQPPNPERR